MITALRHDSQGIQSIPDPDDIDTSLEQGCLVWVDVTDLTEDEANRLIQEFSIDDLAVEDIRDGGLRDAGSTPRTKIEIYEHHAFIAAYSGDLCPVNLLIGERWVTTFRQPNEAGQRLVDRPACSSASSRARSRPSEGSCGASSTRWSTTASTEPVSSKARSRRSRPGSSEPSRSSGTTHRRSSASCSTSAVSSLALQHKVHPMEEVAAKLRDGEVKWVGSDNAKEFENLRNHVLRANDQLTSHRDLVSSEVDALLALASQRLNEVMKTLTGWGSILLGATLIAGIYGMNFTHMPELSWYFGYPTAIGMMLILTFVLVYFLRKRDWL